MLIASWKFQWHVLHVSGKSSWCMAANLLARSVSMLLRGRKEPHAHLFSSLWPEQGPCAELAGSSRALLPSFPGALSCLAWVPPASEAGQGLPGRAGFAAWFSFALAGLGRVGGCGRGCCKSLIWVFCSWYPLSWGFSGNGQDGCQTYRTAVSSSLG